jgi:hypothetical protein
MKKIFVLAMLFALSVWGFSQENEQFISLFNGKDLTGWSMPGEVPGFEVTEGVMVAEPPSGSDIFTTEEFANYIFRFEYLLSEVGNSGVLIRCTPENPWGTGVEVQLLAPWTPYRDDLHCTGSLYGHVAVTNRPDETTGIWHQMEIRCDRNLITVSVDGQVTTEANTDTVESMKGKYISGAIGFQSNHSKKGEFARFRNISIRNLDLEPEYVKAGFFAEDVRFRKSAHEAALKIGASMIEPLSRLLFSESPVAQSGAKQVLFELVAHATAPGVPKGEKNAVGKNLEKSRRNCSEVDVSQYLEWLLEMTKSGRY